MSENNILGVVLAGGQSKRLGTDKSIIKLGQKTLIEHTISKIENKFSEILIITNNKKFTTNKKNIFFIKDSIKGNLGPLVGVFSAMEWIIKKNKQYKWIATFPCDTPFFDNQIIDELKKKSFKKDKKLFFLKSGEKRHNIFGLWQLSLKKTLEEDIKNNYRKVEEWADKIGLETINVDTKNFNSFLNINTKDDLEEAKKNLDKI